MLKTIETFFFGKVLGRVVARLALSAVSGLAAYLAAHGIELTADQQAAAITALVGGANALYSKISDWRAKRAAAAAPAPAPAA
jgi:hypothetical protein